MPIFQVINSLQVFESRRTQVGPHIPSPQPILQVYESSHTQVGAHALLNYFHDFSIQGNYGRIYSLYHKRVTVVYNCTTNMFTLGLVKKIYTALQTVT